VIAVWKDREPIGWRVEAGVIAERAFHSVLVRIDVAFDHDFGIGRRFDGLRHAPHELHRLAAQIARQQILVDVGRQRRGGAPHRRRISAEDDRTRNNRLLFLLCHALVFCAALVPLPVHHQGAIVLDLQAIHAHVADVAQGIARDDLHQRDVPAAVERPAFEEGQLREGNLIVGTDDFLHRRVAHDLRPQPDRFQHPEEIAPAIERGLQPLRQFEIDCLGEVVIEVFQIVHRPTPCEALPKALINTGRAEPLTFSNNSALF
jgi:hypothetical protein